MGTPPRDARLSDKEQQAGHAHKFDNVALCILQKQIQYFFSMSTSYDDTSIKNQYVGLETTTRWYNFVSIIDDTFRVGN